MHDWRKQLGPGMVGELSGVPELGDTCVRNRVAWPIGKAMCGAITTVNDVTSRILASGGSVEFQEGNGCRDRGGTSCACAFDDVTRIRGNGRVTQLHSLHGGRDRHPPQFRQAPRPGTHFEHDLDAGRPL